MKLLMDPESINNLVLNLQLPTEIIKLVVTELLVLGVKFTDRIFPLNFLLLFITESIITIILLF